RNGRFLCACFTRLSGRFPSVLRFRLYQILAGQIFAGAFPPFGFFAFPTLPDPFPSLAPVGAGSAASLSLFGLSDFNRSGFASIPVPISVGVPPRSSFLLLPFRRGYYFSGFPWRLIIESAGSNFGNAKEDP
ncbi:hypothetical protein, partial [Streptomyces sp. NPDC048611]|uniref:hypothetical protein n=1 Tax=Streptomyces sp. NPDC048611 TaxID=3155635 RepID=UPI0034170F16